MRFVHCEEILILDLLHMSLEDARRLAQDREVAVRTTLCTVTQKNRPIRAAFSFASMCARIVCYRIFLLLQRFTARNNHLPCLGTLIKHTVVTNSPALASQSCCNRHLMEVHQPKSFAFNNDLYDFPEEEDI